MRANNTSRRSERPGSTSGSSGSAPEHARRRIGHHWRILGLPALAVALFLACGHANAAPPENPPDPAPAVSQSYTVPEPAVPWLALVFAVALIALRHRMRSH